MSLSPSYLYESNYCQFYKTFALYSASLAIKHSIVASIKAFAKWGEKEADSVLFISSKRKSSICSHLLSLKDVMRDYPYHMHRVL